MQPSRNRCRFSNGQPIARGGVDRMRSLAIHFIAESLMRLVLLSLAFVVGTSCMSFAQLDESKYHDPSIDTERFTATGTISLHDVVPRFNEIASQHSVGKSQEELTVDEVISAIRRAVGTSKTAGQPEMRASTQAALDRIVQTGNLSKGDELLFATGYTSSGRRYTVWWIDIVSDSYRLRLRDRTLSSRALTAEEMAENARRELAWQRAMKYERTSPTGEKYLLSTDFDEEAK